MSKEQENEDNEIEIVKEMQLLITRANQYEKNIYSETKASNTSTPKGKQTQRNNNFLKCKNHDNNSKSWSSENASCGVCYNFEVIESLGERPILPRIGEVLSLVLTKKLPGRQDCLLECAYEIALKWINCNLYPVSVQTIKRRLDVIYNL